MSGVTLKPGELSDLCRTLVQRGWWVTAAEKTPHTVLIGFNFLPRKHPCWLKAFEVPLAAATVEGVEAAVEAWKAEVRERLANGMASALVRQMIAEHGLDVVREAMRAGVAYV